MLVGRVGARRTVFVGSALLGGSSLVFGFAENIVLLDAARFVQGLASACSWAGALSWLVQSAPAARRGELIGTALAAAVFGALFGPVLGTLAEATSPRLVFSCVGLVTVGLCAWAALTPPPPAAAAGRNLAAVLAALRRPRVRRSMWLVGLAATAFGMMAVLGPLRLDHLGASGAVVGGVYLAAALLETAVSPWVGWLSDRRGRLSPIRVGLTATAALLCCFTLPGTVAALAVLLVAIAVCAIAVWTPAVTALSDAAETAGLEQGLAFALVNVAWGIGQVAGSGGGGVAADAVGDALGPLVLAAVAIVTVLVVRDLSDPRPA
jgi:predicted MFS family arabinose efflux permease